MDLVVTFLDRRESMCAKCPAYRVDWAIMEAVEQTLVDWSGEVAHLFLQYQESLKEGRALCRAAAYRRGQELAETRPALEELASQEDILGGLPTDIDIRPLWNALWDALPRPGGVLPGLLDLYSTAELDARDFEAMFFCLFGYQDRVAQLGKENPALSAWLREVIEPTWIYELPWWDGSHLRQERIS